MEQIPISKFKARCLAILERVRRTGKPILITRFGEPVAEVVRPYLEKLSRAELFALMVTGMATIAGTMMVLYASILSGLRDDALGQILAASVISVPAALVVAMVLVPGQGETTDAGTGFESEASSASPQPWKESANTR